MDEYLQAVLASLQAAPISLAADECNVCPDGKPDPTAGQRFASIHSGNVVNRGDDCIDASFSFKITLTLRTDMNPRDRVGSGNTTLGANTALNIWKLADKIWTLVHRGYTITTAAQTINPLINFCEPVVFDGANYLGPVGPEWFWAEGTEPGPTGIAVELSFSKGRWIKYIGEAGET